MYNGVRCRWQASLHEFCALHFTCHYAVAEPALAKVAETNVRDFKKAWKSMVLNSCRSLRHVNGCRGIQFVLVHGEGKGCELERQEIIPLIQEVNKLKEEWRDHDGWAYGLTVKYVQPKQLSDIVLAKNAPDAIAHCSDWSAFTFEASGASFVHMNKIPHSAYKAGVEFDSELEAQTVGTDDTKCIGYRRDSNGKFYLLVDGDGEWDGFGKFSVWYKEVESIPQSAYKECACFDSEQEVRHACMRDVRCIGYRRDSNGKYYLLVDGEGRWDGFAKMTVWYKEVVCIPRSAYKEGVWFENEQDVQHACMRDGKSIGYRQDSNGTYYLLVRGLGNWDGVLKVLSKRPPVALNAFTYLESSRCWLLSKSKNR